MTQRKVMMPARPDIGVIGAPMKLSTNRYRTQIKPDLIIYHYDVHVSNISRDDERLKKSLSTDKSDLTTVLLRETLSQIMIKVASENGWGHGWAYDGKKSLYSVSPELSKDRSSHHVTIKEGGVDTTFLVQVTPVKIEGFAIDMGVLQSLTASAEEAVMALDVVIRHTISLRPNIINVSNKIFPPGAANTRMDLGGGVESWQGYYQSLRMTQSGLTLNIEAAVTGFYVAGNVIDFMVKFLKLRSPNDLKNVPPMNLKKVSRVLKGLKITVNHLAYKRTYKSFGLVKSGLPATKHMFPKDGKEVSVASYFAEAYHPLKYGFLPCLDVGGDRENPRAMPLEVCIILPGQRVKSLDPVQTAEVLKDAAVEPHIRRDRIAHHFKNSQFEADETLRSFGVKVEPTMMEVNARVLPPPHIQYGNNQSIKAQLGTWNLLDVKFHAPAQMVNWGVVCCLPQNQAENPRDGPEATLAEFISYLVKTAKGCGMFCNTPSTVIYQGKMGMEQAMMEVAGRCGQASSSLNGFPCQMILVVIPNKPSPLYNETKYQSDVNLGIPSQCVVAKNAGIGFFPKRRDQYCHNLCLKLNAKLGGVNSVIKSEAHTFEQNPKSALGWITDRPYMIFGADVTHPAPGSSAPSVAAVVGSLNKSATRFAARILLQEVRKDKVGTELITELQKAIRELIEDFMSQNRGMKPERILMYRDGVSEGQFPQCLSHELPLLKAACRDLDPGYCPPVTFITVQKRHNTRFFPTNPANGDKSGNILPGTVVDTGVCHRTNFDFYLNSHAGLKGTNKPAHYCVLFDENGFEADSLQLLTYRLCYGYARCTRSVSLVPAAYYAHLAAFRGRALLAPDDDSDKASSCSGTTGGGGMMTIAKVHDNLKTTMFYT